MIDPFTSSGCTINGEPAVVIRVAELNDLTARLHQPDPAAILAVVETALDCIQRVLGAARTTADNPLAARDAHLAQLRDQIVDLRRTTRLQVETIHSIAAERDGAIDATARVRALAADMRTCCSPHGIATLWAQRIDDAIDGKEPTP